MPAEGSALDLADQLRLAQTKIAELESANAELRKNQLRAEQSFQQSSLILESISDAFIAVDREFRYIWVNAETERFTGMSRDQLLGRTIWELFAGLAGTSFERYARQALEDQITLEFENYYPPWKRWFVNKAYPTKEGGLAIYWRDITEQKRLQTELRRQAALLEQVHDSIITVDLDGVITHWNHGAEKMYGYEAREVLGRSISLLYFESDPAPIRAELWEPLMRDGQCVRQLKNRRKSGEECFVHVSLSLLRDESFQPYGILGVSIDITAQKQAERSLVESEARYRSFADAMPQVAYITGADGRTEAINSHWERYSGIAAVDCLEFDWLAWIHPEDASEILPKWTKCIDTGELFDMEYRLRNAAGDYRWHLSRAVPIRDPQGTITQWVGTLTDIHHQKGIEEALRRSNEDLEQFAYAASHDLQEPLRTVSIYSQLLAGKYGGESQEAGKFARYIGSGVDQIESLLQGILAYSRARDAAEVPVRTASGAALESALLNLAPAIQENGAIVTHADLPPVLFPQAQLVQLFQNLIGNAIKYRSESTPRIHVSAVRQGGWEKFSIEDNGIGIRPEYLEIIFGVFKRLHKGKYPGVGVGLAICKRIVERQGGRICAESEAGKGTTFHVTLPAVP